MRLNLPAMPNEQVPYVSKALAADGGADGYAYVASATGLYPGLIGWIYDDDASSQQKVLLTQIAKQSDGQVKVGLRFLPEGLEDAAVRAGTVTPTSLGRSSLTAYTLAKHSIMCFDPQLVDRRYVEFPSLAVGVADPATVLFAAAAIASVNTYTSAGIRILANTRISFIASWTGTPTGTWSFETSNDSTNGVNGIWVALTLPSGFAAGNPAGGVGSFDFEFADMAEGWIRSKLAVSAGSGGLTETAEIK